jgi:hypothetical protein
VPRIPPAIDSSFQHGGGTQVFIPDNYLNPALELPKWAAALSGLLPSSSWAQPFEFLVAGRAYASASCDAPLDAEEAPPVKLVLEQQPVFYGQTIGVSGDPGAGQHRGGWDVGDGT